MRPEKINKLPIEKTRKVVYLLIFLICMVAIGIALYYQYYKDEKLGVIFGITDEQSEREEELSELKYISIEELEKVIENKDEKYTFSKSEYFEKLIEILKEKRKLILI